MPQPSRIVLGLNSGTSADGVDAACCKITGRGTDMRLRLLGHVHVAYPAALRRRLLAVMAPASTHTEEICRLEVEVGRAFTRCARKLQDRLGIRRFDLVGSHGQTICHLPPGHASGSSLASRAVSASRSVSAGLPHSPVPSTMQIGDAAVIAAALDCPVVHKFRQADVAVGGQGAPLIPWTDYVLFRDARRSRVLQNIGGIANLTWLPAGGGVEEVIAFDTGPGNMLIDALVRRFSRGKVEYDRGGRRAARGRCDMKLLSAMLDHSFLAAAPPKSCGREQFGETYLDELMKRFTRLRLSPNDWIATATAFTAASIFIGLAFVSDMARLAFPPMDELVLCGGGARNGALVGQIKQSLAASSRKIHLSTTHDYGLPIQAKEAASFALLAVACVDGTAANLPRVTGASRCVVLGQICDIASRKRT